MLHINTIYRVSRITQYKDVFELNNGTNGYYRYAAKGGDDSALFIYSAITEELCMRNGFSGCTEKLNEYFKMMGYASDIWGIIKSLIKESNTIYIDGIIEFRLKKYKSDIAAFFDMLAHADTIKKSFSGFPVKCSISFLE